MSNNRHPRNKISQKISAIASIFGSHKKSQPAQLQINVGKTTMGRSKKKSRSNSRSATISRKEMKLRNISSESNSMSVASTTTSTNLTSPLSISSTLLKGNKLFLSHSTSLMAPSPSAELECGVDIASSPSPTSPTLPVSPTSPISPISPPAAVASSAEVVVAEVEAEPTPISLMEAAKQYKPTEIVISIHGGGSAEQQRDDHCKSHYTRTVSRTCSTPSGRSTRLSVIERQFPEYMKMSPIDTPPQPMDVSTPMSFQHLFAIISEQQQQQQGSYEESLSLNDASYEYEYDDEDEDDDAEIVFPSEHEMKKEVADTKLFCAMSLPQFLHRFDIGQHAALGHYLTHDLGLKKVNDLMQFSPQQILSESVLKRVDYRTKLSLQKMVHFIATQIATTQHWPSGDHAHAWQQFDVFGGKVKLQDAVVARPKLQKSCDSAEVLSASIDDARYWLFGGQSNRCCLSGRRCRYLSKEIHVRELESGFSMAMEIEACSKRKFSDVDDTAFVVGMEFVDLQETLCINDRFQLLRNDKLVERVSMQPLNDGSRLCFSLSRQEDLCVVAIQIDGDNAASCQQFCVKESSKIQLFVKQFHGRCTYGIYPVIQANE